MDEETKKELVRGVRLIAGAIRRWPSNPERPATMREVWGSRPRPTLLLLCATAIAAGIVLPTLGELFERWSFLRWFFFLSIPLHMMWSGQAVLALIAAWRLRALRRSPPPSAHPDRGRLRFEAAFVPLILAILVVAMGLQLESLIETINSPEESIAPLDLLRSVAYWTMTASLTIGMLFVHADLAKGIKNLFSAAISVWVAHFGIAVTLPWFAFAWAWIPGIGHRFTGPFLTLASMLVDLGVAAAVWAVAADRAARPGFWEPSAPPPIPESTPDGSDREPCETPKD